MSMDVTWKGAVGSSTSPSGAMDSVLHPPLTWVTFPNILLYRFPHAWPPVSGRMSSSYPDELHKPDRGSF